VLFDYVRVGSGARIHRAILDKNVELAPGATVGVDRERDIARGFTVTDSGLTVVGKNVRVDA
jgi:glucose-1-phosphate adenylyltransferase